MTDSLYDKGAALAGLGFVLLAGVASAIAPTTLKLDLSAAEVRSKLSGDAGALAAGALLTALAMLALGLFIGYVYRRLRASDPGNGSSLPTGFALAGTVLVTIGLLGAALQALVAHHAADLDDSALLLAFRLWQFVSYNISALPVLVVMGIAGVRTLQAGVFPRWTGAIAVVSAVAGAIASSVLWTTGEPAPTWLDTGAFALSSLWIATVSIAAVVRPVGAATAAIQPA